MNDPHMTAKVLRRAAELVEQGWRRGGGVTGEEDGRWCAIAALTTAGEQLDACWAEARLLAMDAQGVTSLMWWNDMDARDGSEVAALFRRAADLAEGDPERSDAR